MQSPPFGWKAGGPRRPPGSPCVRAGPEHIRSSFVSLAIVRRLARSRPRISLTPVVYPLGPPWQPSSGSEDHSPSSLRGPEGTSCLHRALFVSEFVLVSGPSRVRWCSSRGMDIFSVAHGGTTAALFVMSCYQLRFFGCALPRVHAPPSSCKGKAVTSMPGYIALPLVIRCGRCPDVGGLHTLCQPTSIVVRKSRAAVCRRGAGGADDPESLISFRCALISLRDTPPSNLRYMIET